MQRKSKILRKTKLSAVGFSISTLAGEQMSGHFGSNETIGLPFETHAAHFFSNGPVGNSSQLVLHL